MRQADNIFFDIYYAGGDLLMSLTTTFDRKLKSLLTEEEEKKLNGEDGLSIKKRNSFAAGQPDIADNSLFRDPSLHRTFERTSKAIDVQVINIFIFLFVTAFAAAIFREIAYI